MDIPFGYPGELEIAFFVWSATFFAFFLLVFTICELVLNFLNFFVAKKPIPFKNYLIIGCSFGLVFILTFIVFITRNIHNETLLSAIPVVSMLVIWALFLLIFVFFKKSIFMIISILIGVLCGVGIVYLQANIREKQVVKQVYADRAFVQSYENELKSQYKIISARVNPVNPTIINISLEIPKSGSYNFLLSAYPKLSPKSTSDDYLKVGIFASLLHQQISTNVANLQFTSKNNVNFAEIKPLLLEFSVNLNTTDKDRKIVPRHDGLVIFLLGGKWQYIDNVLPQGVIFYSPLLPECPISILAYFTFCAENKLLTIQ